MNRPSLEKIKEGQYSWSIESKRKGGTGWAAEGMSKGKITGNFRHSVRELRFYFPVMRSDGRI